MVKKQIQYPSLGEEKRTVYKVVTVPDYFRELEFPPPHFVSALAINPIIVSIYQMNRKTTSLLIGKQYAYMFAFDSIECARDFADVYVSGYSYVLECRAAVVNMGCNFKTQLVFTPEFVHDFWNGDMVVEYPSTPPLGTLFCRWITPLRVVAN